MITGTTTDYTGRTLDIYISGTLDPLSPDIQQVNYSFGNPTKYVAGIQKLAQRYLISLLNSEFIQEIQGASASNIQAATHIFNLNSWAVVQAFKTYQNANLTAPLDEQLSTVQLTNISSYGDTVNFSAQLISKAGSAVIFVLPLPLI